MSTDVIVIGGGIIGSSITYHLARDGVKVTQIEKGSIANQGAASRATAGGIRLNNRDPRELELAKEGIKRWKTLEAELEADLEYKGSGQIVLFEDHYEDDVLKAQLEQDLKKGIEAKIVTGAELDELVPSLSPTINRAIFYPSGGQGNGLLTTVAYTNQARRLGANIMTGVEVFAIVKEKDKVVGVETSEGFFSAGAVVNAAGAWSPVLHETLGMSLPQIKPYIHQMSATDPAPLSTLPGPTIGARGMKISLKQTIDGRIRAGGGYSTKPGPSPYLGRFNQNELAKQRETVLKLIPSLSAYEVDYTYYGVEAHCVDDIPILGPVPEVEGYFIAAGFSGHGFTLSPAIGMVISEVVQGKSPSISIEEFRINRSYDQVFNHETIRNVPG